jgi:hypothetical protein
MQKDKDPGAMKIWTLNAFGTALYGPRYQRELAAALGVNERTMRRWVAGDYPPPEGVLADLRKLAAERVRELRELSRLKN